MTMMTLSCVNEPCFVFIVSVRVFPSLFPCSFYYFFLSSLPNVLSPYLTLSLASCISDMHRPLPQRNTHRTTNAAQMSLGKVVTKTSFGTNEQLWDKLVELGFFDARPCCPTCHTPLNTKQLREDLHFSTQCWKCKETVNLLDGSLLKGVKKLRTFLHATITWATNGKVSTMMAESGIAPKTWSSIKEKLQQTVDQTLERLVESGEMKLGGPGKVVEVDECKLYTPKYHRGHPQTSSDVWVVGLLERDKTGGRKSAFVLTTDRSASFLIPFINKWVRKKSILVSDCWKGYSKELEKRYVRPKINHSVEFARTEVVNGVEMSVNTNHIEREWREIRKVFACKSLEVYNSELNKEIFRLLFLGGLKGEQQAYVVLKKMAELAK